MADGKAPSKPERQQSMDGNIIKKTSPKMHCIMEM